MKIVLIACVSKKKSRKCKAKDLYDSPWFRLAYRYAQSLNPDQVFILSAKYGLVNPHTEIEPYETTLNTMSDRDITAWANRVMEALRKQTSVDKDTFIILAGESYRKNLVGQLRNCQVPMKGLRIGEQLKWLKEHSPR